MDEQEIIEIIKSTLGCANGNLAKYFYKHKSSLDIILNLTNFLPETASLSDRFFYIRNDIKHIKICKYCNKKLLRNLKGTFCSAKCNINYQIKNTNIIERRSKTLSKNYKNKSFKEKELIKKKRKGTNLARYGVENNLHAPSVKEEKIKTWVNKYGVDNPSKSEVIKTKRKETNIKKYGGVTPFSGREQKEKRKETWIKNYGVDNPVKNKSVRLKMKKTYFMKTGYSSPMKNPDVIKKIRKTFFKNEGMGRHKRGYRYKIYSFPSGRKILLQGYENGALDNYLLNIYEESDIENNIKIINSFKFEYGQTVSGIKRRYIPDFYIKKDNLFIEVKSEYLYNKNLEGIYLKAKSIIDRGYNFYILVSSDNKNFKKIVYEEIKTDIEKENS